MALPTIYAEDTLAAFMRDQLKTMVNDLGWQTEAFTEPINDLLLAYGNGVTSLAQCTDIPLVRALARVGAWKAVEEATVGDYDTEDNGDAIKRSQVHAQAVDQRALAESALQTLLDARIEGTPAEIEATRRIPSRSRPIVVTLT